MKDTIELPVPLLKGTSVRTFKGESFGQCYCIPKLRYNESSELEEVRETKDSEVEKDYINIDIVTGTTPGIVDEQLLTVLIHRRDVDTQNGIDSPELEQYKEHLVKAMQSLIDYKSKLEKA